MTTVAVPLAYRDDLAPVTLSFDLEQTQDEVLTSGLDFEQIASARAVITRPDAETLDWDLDVALDPAATETTITLTHDLDFADLFVGALPIVGTYEIRFLVTDVDGEHVIEKQWFDVTAF